MCVNYVGLKPAVTFDGLNQVESSATAQPVEQIDNWSDNLVQNIQQGQRPHRHAHRHEADSLRCRIGKTDGEYHEFMFLAELLQHSQVEGADRVCRYDRIVEYRDTHQVDPVA